MKIAVVGGCGHVGLPLAVELANSSHDVVAFDISESAVKVVNSGKAPFWEPGLDDALIKARSSDFTASLDPKVIEAASIVIVVVGTPVDSHLNPNPNVVLNAIDGICKYLNDEQLLILRSTVFPGVTEQVEKLLVRRGLNTCVVFCPERIAEGFALTELHQLPQIVGAR